MKELFDTIRSDTNRDAKVAKHVMGWTVAPDPRPQCDGMTVWVDASGVPQEYDPGGLNLPVVNRIAATPPFTTDGGADNLARVRIAATFDYEQFCQFCECLRFVWKERCSDPFLFDLASGAFYHPGDWSVCALAALTLQKASVGYGSDEA